MRKTNFFSRLRGTLEILELKKLPKEAQNEEGVLAWMRFLSRKNKEEFEQMAKMNEYFDEAYNELLELSADEKKRLRKPVA